MLFFVVVDRFGVINVFNIDKFGVFWVLGESRFNVCCCINNMEEFSIGFLILFL